MSSSPEPTTPGLSGPAATPVDEDLDVRARSEEAADGAPPELEILVERTRGLQPWRRLYHAANGVAVAVALSWLDLSRPVAVAILGGVALLLLASDLLRLLYAPANALFFRVFRRLASPREVARLASSTWYALGLAVTVLLFPREQAVSGILVLALADPTGSYLGRRWGQRPFLGGTVLGSASFATVAFAVLAFRHAVPAATVAALCATLAERRSWPLDDNLAVPVVTAAVLSWVGLLI